MESPLKHMMEKLHGELEGIGSLKKEMMLRLALLRHQKSPDQHKLELLIELTRLNRELEAKARKVRTLPCGTTEENVYVERIRDLEDERFQLLSALNGKQIAEYNWSPPELR